MITETTCEYPDLGNDKTICEAYTVTLDSKISQAGYTFQWHKGNNKLPHTTASIATSETGIYRIDVEKAGCPAVFDYIQVKSNLLNATADSVCSTNPATATTLNAIGTGTYLWYNASTAGTLLGSGNTITVTPTATTTYYLQDTKVTPYSLGLPTPTTTGDWTIGGSFADNQNRSKLVVASPLWLKSIALNVTSANTKGVIRITNDVGSIVTSATASNLAVGTQAITFNYLLSPGTYYIDAVGTTGNVRFQSSKTGAVWSIPNYVTMTQLSGWGYGIFFDVKFDVGNACARTPVQAVVKNCTPPLITQTIALAKGWNLISTNVCTSDSSIATLFNGLDVIEIKDMNSFWRNDQTNVFNSLLSITPAQGYLVNMNAAGTLTTSGMPLSFSNFQIPASSNWYLIGCPYQSITPFSQDFTTTNCSVIKNFDGFWTPNGTANSISTSSPGNGYFIKK